MANLVLPLRVVALQLLFLLVATAIEAYVLQRRLGMTPKGSAQYSLVLNLFTTVAGWMLFFTIQPLLPPSWQLEIFSFIFFSRFFEPEFIDAMRTLGIILGFVVFMGTFFLKSVFFSMMLNLWASPNPAVPQYDTSQIQLNRMQRYRQSWTARIRSSALLMGTAASFAAILVMILVLQQAG